MRYTVYMVLVVPVLPHKV